MQSLNVRDWQTRALFKHCILSDSQISWLFLNTHWIRVTLPDKQFSYLRAQSLRIPPYSSRNIFYPSWVVALIFKTGVFLWRHYQELSYYRNRHSGYRYSILDRRRLIPFDWSSYLCSWCAISSVSHTPTVLLQFRLNHVWMHFRILDPIHTGLGPS